MTNPNRSTESAAAVSVPKPELVPRLVLFFVALVIGGIVAVSFGHGVNIYGYRMEQSVIKLQGNPEQYEKTTNGNSKEKWIQYSLTDSLETEGAQSVENTMPEFYYRFVFDENELTNNHKVWREYVPREDGECEPIIVDETPIDPIKIDSPEGNVDKKSVCHYVIDFDDFFTWDVTKPAENEDGANE